MSSPLCPACGAESRGRFCAGCGAALPLRCSGCDTPIPEAARFCHHCGAAVAARPPARMPVRERRAWLVAGVVLIAMLGAIVLQVVRGLPQPVTPDMANPGAGAAPAAPDISNLSPRERFDRLFERVMQAGAARDSATVVRFTPMALAAYQQLDSVDADGRFHAALLQVQIGNFAAALALADTILAADPNYLFGYIVRGTVAGFADDAAARRQSYREFLAHYQAAMAADGAQYAEHPGLVEAFKTAAERELGLTPTAGP